MNGVFPWQEPAWQYLVNRKNLDNLPHAILITGVVGVGKDVFAKNLAYLLLCRESSRQGVACGECAACILLEAGNHPDLIVIQPEDKGRAIKIDQIRELIEGLNNSSHQGGYKLALIESAELLNSASANALLKTLEEPTPHTVIILISAFPHTLPATVRSRCQTLLVRAPEHALAKNWLEHELPNADVELLLALAENAPLLALNIAVSGMLPKRQEFFSGLSELLQEKISSMQMVDRCLEWQLEELLIILMYIVGDLLKIKLGVGNHLVNHDQIGLLTRFAASASIRGLISYQDHLYKLRGLLQNKINLNQQLVVENLLIGWLQIK